MRGRRIAQPSALVLLWTAIATYAAGFSALSILRHRAFSTGRFDLGNMVQAVWSTAHGHPLQITGLRGDQISRLGAHFDPILAVFAPLWLVWPSPDLLLVSQAVAVALGALPVYWLARKHLGSEQAALGFALAYLLYPPTQWLTLNEFHPVALACPLLLFAIWYLDEDRLLPFAAFGLLAATTKEEIAFVVAGLGVWYAFSHRRRLPGAAIFVAGTAVALIAIEVVIPHFNRAGTSSFFTRYSEVGSTPAGIVHTALTDPWRLVTTAATGRGLGYLASLVAPARPARRVRAAGADRGASGAGDQPALRSDHPDLDPLPLHRRPDPGADRGRSSRSGPNRPAQTGRGPAPRDRRGRARAHLELPNTGDQVMRAFDAGWGGAVWKTLGNPIVNVEPLRRRRLRRHAS